MAGFAFVAFAQTPEPEFSDVFFRLVNGTLTPLERQDGAIRSSANGFIVMSVKGGVEVPGKQSPVRFSGGTFDFVVRAPGGMATMDPDSLYHLRRLTSKHNRREALLTSGHASPVGATMHAARSQGLIPLDFSHHGSHSYRIRVSDLAPGEYALGRAGGRTVFCFGVD